MTTDSALRYDHTGELTGDDSLSRIAALVEPGSTVLDLGAATGALGRFLREQKQCAVDGVEFEAKAAALARPHYRKLAQLNLEEQPLAGQFAAGAYDAIICADVLEHLRDPGKVLDQLAALLKPAGRVLISIPNVGYAGVVAGLIAGEFKYRETGLLDATHLRWFTRSSLQELLRVHGFHARSISPLFAEVTATEFREHRLDQLPPAVLRALLAQPDALAYQFIVEAAPGPGIAPKAPSPAPLRFGVQLFWSSDGSLAESRSAFASGAVGEEAQKLRLAIPPLAPPPTLLRFDLADRPGYLRLRALSLHDAAGAALWTWDGRGQSLLAPRQLVQLGDTFLSVGDDPSVELPVPPAALAHLAGGGALEATVDWPMSADYALAQELVDERSETWKRERALLLRKLEGLEAELVKQRTTPALNTRRIDTLEKQLRSVERTQLSVLAQIERFATRLATLELEPEVQRVLGKARRELLPFHYRLQLMPVNDLRQLGEGEWESTGPDPHFELRSDNYPGAGWVLFEADLVVESRTMLRPALYIDTGLGYSEKTMVRLPPSVGGRIRAEINLPPGVRALRIDPLDGPGRFRFSLASLRELGKVRAGVRFAAPIARELVARPDRIAAAAEKAWSIFRRGGLPGLKHALIDRARKTGTVHYRAWIEEFDTLTPEDRQAIAARIEQLAQRPRFSLLMPVYDPPEKWLRRAIESVRTQLYPDWELCIADDASSRPHVRKVLEEAARSDPRIKVVMRPENGHISAASNSALELATGGFIALLDHDDELAPHALYMMAEELAAHPETDFVYSDEDKIDEHGERYEPHFKPEWNPDLLDSTNYVAHLACYRTSLVRELGGFRKGVEGSQDYDLTLRVTARTDRIRHVPFVLYHWRAIEGSTATEADNKGYSTDAGMKALRDRHPDCSVLPGPFPTTYRVKHPLPAEPPLVSLIIPTRDGFELLSQAIESILAKTSYPNYEIVIVDNQSTEPRALAYMRELAEAGKARVLKYDAPFNYSAINNFAVAQARGELVCLLNNDVEIIEPQWLSELASQALRPGIGAVGCKLLYPDGTIQHAGTLMGAYGIAGHLFQRQPANWPGYFRRAQLVQNLSGCTAACLILRKSVYEEVGGLDEVALRVAFNDVDFCLRVQAAGYRNLYTPFAVLTHHESATRGLEDTPEKRERFRGETEFVRERWGSVLDNDPAYNPNLSLQSFEMDLAWPPRVVKPWRSSGS